MQDICALDLRFTEAFRSEMVNFVDYELRMERWECRRVLVRFMIHQLFMLCHSGLRGSLFVHDSPWHVLLGASSHFFDPRFRGHLSSAECRQQA